MRKVAGVLVAAAMLLPVGLIAAPAGAAVGTSCAVQTGTATIKPGITPKAANVTITVKETLSKCTGGGVTGGTETASVVSKAATCSGLAKVGTKTGPIVGTITWNTKKTSAVSITTTSNVLKATATGTVKSGLFAGGKISTAIVYALSKGTCSATSPLTALTIKGTKPLVIT
ncbi:MAG: hypothetical protein ACLPVY_05005 [Acidimicrobiia bacterium]